jgi:hypothetical protein
VKGEKLDISSKNGAIILKRKKIVGVSDIRGIIGRGKVTLQDIEDTLGKE